MGQNPILNEFSPSNAATPQRRNASPFGVPLEPLWKAKIIMTEQSF
jgi:hypothetical protein